MPNLEKSQRIGHTPSRRSRLPQTKQMVIVRSDLLRKWLETTGRNQSWLAHQLGVTRGYVSQIINADTKCSMAFVERILLITHMQFERLFYFDGQPDGRAFYGKQLWFKEKIWERSEYHEEIKRKLASEIWGGQQNVDKIGHRD